MSIKIHPTVDAVIKPIVYEMTKISLMQKTSPMIDSHNEPENIKRRKRDCVHIIYDGNEYRLSAAKNAEGKLVCEVCGREIGTKFNDESVETIMKAITVVNQVLLFGMVNGLRAEPIQTLISLKQTLPDVAQLLKQLNDYVRRDTANADSEKNIGIEYKFPGAFNSITSM